MNLRLHETSIEHEVPFHDVDLTRRVWHGHYYKYLELARTALFRTIGLDDEALIPRQFSLYVIETHCRYVFPLRSATACACPPGSATSSAGWRSATR